MSVREESDKTLYKTTMHALQRQWSLHYELQTFACCIISHHQCCHCWDCEESNRRREELRKRVAFSRSCSWKCTRCDKSWKKFENQMNSVLFTMSTLINKKSYAHTLYDTECLFYEMITSCFAKTYNLQCMKIRSHIITEFDEPSNSSVNKVAVVQIDINRHQKSRAFFYIVFKLASYNLILNLSWMKQNKIILNADRVFLMIEFTKTIIQNREASAESEFNHVMMSATFFMNLIQKKEEKQKKIEVFSVSIIDIKKALISQKKTNLRTILSDHYHEFLNVFDCIMTEKLPFLREEGTDYQIELKEMNEKESKVLWGPLYNMIKEKLLVLHKTLTELLNKQFIQVSNSSAAVSVLFIQKSEDELQFCVNYCGLNWITQKNCYSLSLIYKTL